MAKPTHHLSLSLVEAKDALNRSQQEVMDLRSATKALQALTDLQTLPRELPLPEPASLELSRCLGAFFEPHFPVLTKLLADGLDLRLHACQQGLETAMDCLDKLS